MFVIRHKTRKNYYQKTLFKSQRHFVKEIKEARQMNYKQAHDILTKFKNMCNYEIVRLKSGYSRY